MNHRIRLATFALSLGAGLFLSTTPARADNEHSGQKTGNQAATSAEADAADHAKAKAEYPLDTCVVSGDPLEGGDMGETIEYVHKEEGKPDRLVRLCCKSCVRDFKKDPAKYLKALDDAAAGSRTSPSTAAIITKL